MGDKQLTDEERAALRATFESALRELTTSLTQVLKAVNKVHKAVSRLGNVMEANPKPTSGKRQRSSDQ